MISSRTKHSNLESFRIYMVLGAFLFVFFLADLRLFQIQVLDHSKYKSMAQQQYSDTYAIPAKRGNILSFDGHVLAGTQTHYLMYGEPKVVEDPYKTSHDLSDIVTDLWMLSSRKDKLEGIEQGQKDIEISRDTVFSYFYNKFYKSLSSGDLMWVPLKRSVTPVERTKIEEKNIKGIGFEEEPIRYYPEGSLASHVLGFVASNEKGEKTGYYGIEGKLNEDLKGKPGRIMDEKDAMGMPILVGSYKKIDSVSGRDVYLTLDRAVQYIIEKKIKEGVEKYEAKSGSVIVMDPMTGEIVAMANFPTYFPDDFSAADIIEDEKTHRKSIERQNLAISQTYEPGSVMKPMTVSAAVDLGLITPETTFNDSGPVRYSDYTIDNWDGKHHSVQTIVELLQKSNNIGAAWVGHKVGSKKLYEYLKNFGFGDRTGIDLEGEDTGIIRDYNEWTDIDLATISFGQGISATPLQVVNAFNVIANGGYLLEPKIIYKITDGIKEIEMPTRSEHRVISRETSDTMVSMLEKAVEGGEAKYFVIKDYRVAGKTGTAQIPENGKYSPDRTNATFVGFMASSRKFSMIVKLEQPQTSTYAAETAVPLWMDICGELVKYFGLPPDKIDTTKESATTVTSVQSPTDTNSIQNGDSNIAPSEDPDSLL